MMSSDLRRKILSPAFFDPKLSEFDKDPSRVFPSIQEISQDSEKLFFIYNNLVKNRTVSQLIELTASFQEVFELFMTTGLTHNPYGSPKLQSREVRYTHLSDFQFSVDMIFIH